MVVERPTGVVLNQEEQVRRHLSWIFAGTMLLGGLAACSDDDDDSGDDDTEETTTTTEGDGGDDSGDSGDGGNADVQAYCDDVDAFVEAALDAGSDPSALAGLTEEATALQESGTELAENSADLSEDDAEALQACTTEAAEALQELIPGG